jgi:hypothetical protein
VVGVSLLFSGLTHYTARTGSNIPTTKDTLLRIRLSNGSGNASAHGPMKRGRGYCNLLPGHLESPSMDSRIFKVQTDLDDLQSKRPGILLHSPKAILASIELVFSLFNLVVY